MDPAPETTIGVALREARARRQLSLGECSERTRIRRKYLEALEGDDYGALPEPAYARSFLRSYAMVLGVEPDALVERLDRDLADEPPTGGAGIELRARDAPRSPRRAGTRRGPSVRRAIWAIIGLLAVVVAGYFAARGLAAPPDGIYFSR